MQLKKRRPKPGCRCLQLFFCILLDNGLSPSEVDLNAAPSATGANITTAQNQVVRHSYVPCTNSLRLPLQTLHNRAVIPIQIKKAQLFAIYYVTSLCYLAKEHTIPFNFMIILYFARFVNRNAPINGENQAQITGNL